MPKTKLSRAKVRMTTKEKQKLINNASEAHMRAERAKLCRKVLTDTGKKI